MEIYRYVLGPLQTNTYMLVKDDQVLLIDPASKAEKLIDVIGDKKLVGILLTHGHFDHIKAVDGLYERFDCPVYLHHDDEYLARDKSSGSEFGFNVYISCPTINPKQGKMSVGDFEIETIYTPGHTRGSVIYIIDDAIFTGDTLFKGSVGRTDLDGGNARDLKDSLRIFKQFDKDYDIYPGHDEVSKLSLELATNYYLR